MMVTMLSVFAGGAYAGPYRDAVLADNPAGYWRLEEGDPTTTGIVNEVASGESGAFFGSDVSLISSVTGPIVSESSNNAINFNKDPNADGTFQVPNGAFASSGAEYSVEYWLKIADGGHTHQNPVVNGDHNVGGGTFHNKRTDKNRLDFGVNSGAHGTAGVAVEDLGEGWAHVVSTMRRDDVTGTSDVKMYINGVLATLIHDPDDGDGLINDVQADNGGTPLTIGGLCCFPGGSNATVNHFNGVLDEVAVYTHVLSAERVLAHYNAAPEPSACVLLLLGGLGLLARRRSA